MLKLLIDLLATPYGVLLVLSVILILVLLIAVLAYYSLREGREVSLWPPKIGPRIVHETDTGPIPGQRLFEHQGYYPVDIKSRSNEPTLNSVTFVSAMNYLLNSANDRLAAMDLVYLREDNLATHGDVLPSKSRHLYERLLKKYRLNTFYDVYGTETRAFFRNIERIVNDLGDTLQDVHFEVLLHDVRNPLRSIIAARNTEEVSKRRLHGPSTRFVVQYVKHQGKDLLEAFRTGSKVAYPKQFTTSHRVKATTTPLYHHRYGLIGILCFNIDVEAIASFSLEEQTKVLDAYMRTTGETPEFEKEDAPEC